MASRTRLVLIEGLPGSGKTSLADWLCSRLAEQGIDACWVPELEDDHPVIDRSTMRTARAEGYADRCVAHWDAFSRKTRASTSPEVWILEGCLFQSSVRFLVEYEHSAREIETYLPRVEDCVAPLRPQLVYLEPTDARDYLEDEILRRKGKDVVARIARYSATTPYAVSRGLHGHAALVSLYATYRDACDRLLERAAMPILRIDAVKRDEAAVRERVVRWLA